MSPRRTPATSDDDAPPAGGLQLPQSVGISSQDLEDIVSKFSTLDAIEEKLVEKGFTDRQKPNYALPDVTPEMLTTPDSREYTNLYAQQLAWRNYIVPQLARAKAALLQCKTQLKLVEQKMRSDIQKTNKLMAKADRLSQTEVETEVETDPTRIEILLVTQQAQQQKDMLEAYYDIAEMNIAVISRQVEIRKIDLESGRRGENLGYSSIRR